MSKCQSAETAPRDGTSILIWCLGNWSIGSWNGRGHWNLEVDKETLAYDGTGEIQTLEDKWVKYWTHLPEQPE